MAYSYAYCESVNRITLLYYSFNLQLKEAHTNGIFPKETSGESSRCEFPYSEDNPHDAEFVTTSPHNIDNDTETKRSEPDYNFPNVSSYTNLASLSTTQNKEPLRHHRLKLSSDDDRLSDIEEYMDTTQDADICCIGKDIRNCIGLQRIMSILSFYSNNYNKSEAINDYLSKYNMRKHLVNDYHHILDKHLNSHNHSERKCEKQFEKIYNKMIEEKHLFCNIKTCNIWKRNNRERETKPNIDIDGDDEHKVSMFIDIINGIHCYFLHCIDIGYRVIMNDDDDDKDNLMDLNMCYDVKMSFLRRYLAPKKALTMKRSNDMRISRFATKLSDNKLNMSGYLRKESLYLKQLRQRYIVLENECLYSYKTDNCEELTECIELKDYEHVQISENGPIGQFEVIGKDGNNKRVFIASNMKELDEWLKALKGNMIADTNLFDFGERFDYWSPDSIYPKYQSIKEEVTSNKIYCISLSAFDAAFNKAIYLRNCHKIRNMMTCSEVTDIYGLRFDATPRIDHILALVLWSDYRILSAEFRATFDSISKKIYDEFWIWSKFLIEAVNAFGWRLKKSKNRRCYHIIECNNDVFIDYCHVLNAPTSTTTRLEIALLNAPKNGIILETTNTKKLRYFNCSFISYFCCENERLFVNPPQINANYKLSVLSIRNMITNENYDEWIDAINVLYKMIYSGFDLKYNIVSDKIVDNINYIISVLYCGGDINIPKYMVLALQKWSDNITQIMFDSYLNNKIVPDVDLYDSNIEYLVRFDKLNVMFKCVYCICIQITADNDSLSMYQCIADMLHDINQLSYSKLNKIRIICNNDEYTSNWMQYKQKIIIEKWNIVYIETDKEIEITKLKTNA